MTPTTPARLQAGLFGFAAAAVVEAGVRSAVVCGSSSFVAVVVFFVCAVVGAVVFARFARAAPVGIALGAIPVFLLGPLWAPSLDAGPVAVVVGRALVALPFVALPGLGVGARGTAHASSTLIGAALATLLSAWSSPVVVVGVAAVVAVVVAVVDKDAVRADVGAGFVVVAFVFVVVGSVGDAAFGGSVYAVATLRAALLLGVAVPLWSTSTSSPALALGAASLGALWTGAVLGWAPALLLWPPPPTSFAGMELGRAIVVVVVVVPVALGAGVVAAVRGNAGFALVAVVVGVVVGAAVVDFAGAQRSLLGLALLLAVASLALGWRSADDRLPVAGTFVAVALLVLLLPRWPAQPLASGTPLSFNVGKVTDRTKIVQVREGRGAVVVVARNKGNKKKQRKAHVMLIENGEVRATKRDQEKEAIIAGHALALTEQRGAALVLGAGTGRVARGLVDGGFARVDVVDHALVVAAARDAFANGAVFDDARVHVVDDDLRAGLARAGRVDVVVVADRPWASGQMSGLATGAFYRQVAQHLESGGVLVQRLSQRNLTDDELRSVVGAARGVFASVSVVKLGRQLLLFGLTSRAAPPPTIAGALDVGGKGAVDVDGDLARTLGRHSPRHVTDAKAPAR